MITARWFLAGAGTQNVGLVIGGYIGGISGERSCTEEYNGTSWSIGGALITARNSLGGAGTQNEGLAMGGSSYAGGVLNCTEEYNGISWSAGGALTISRCLSGAGGAQGSAFITGGGQYPGVTCTEEYNKPIVIIDCIK
jgi:hypothetical protein